MSESALVPSHSAPRPVRPGEKVDRDGTAPAVVIGAGVNALVAAHYLARRGRRGRGGRRVLVLERRTDDDVSADVGWIPRRIVRELALERHGLRVHRPDPWVTAPLPDGGRLELWRDVHKSVEAIRRLSPRDAERWPAFCERMARLAGVLEALYTAPPPDLLSRDLSELVRLGRLGLRVRRLGKRGMVDLLRLLPMSVADLLDEWFESDALKGVLGAAGIMHLAQGPRSAGTAFLLLHHHVGSPPGVFRPPVSNVGRVLRDAAARAGIEVRGGAEVARVTVREGRVRGVVLASGEEAPASLVVSGAEIKRTLLRLVDPGWLDPEFVRAVRNIRCRGVAARVTLTLSRPPDFAVLAVAPSLDYLERAHDDAKYGQISRRPYLEASSVPPGGNGARGLDGATDGRYGVRVHLQYAPYALADGLWDEARRAALGDLVAETLAEHAPALRDTQVSCAVLSPRDLEERYGFPEGQAYHAELALDQALFMRPLAGWARYRTPIEGLYLCGPGTHPGGGVAGASGANAARVVLEDLRRAGRR